LFPLLGRGLFQWMFWSGPQCSGTLFSLDLPSPFGPRKVGQSPAAASARPAARIETAAEHVISCCIDRLPQVADKRIVLTSLFSPIRPQCSRLRLPQQEANVGNHPRPYSSARIRAIRGELFWSRPKSDCESRKLSKLPTN